MKRLNFERILLTITIIFIAVVIFTAIDYLVHGLSPEYSVPDYYFKNKIIFATIIGSIVYFFIRKRVFWQKSLIVSLVTAVLLQIKYYLQGYPKEFVFEFMLFHFLMFLASSMLMFYLFRKRI